MKFSLILSTKNRTAEIERAFEGFRGQTLQDFEVIVSDQNEDNRVIDLLERMDSPLKVKHIRSQWGLSAARNKALEIAQGELIGFPDDDCKYLPNLLADVAGFFDTHPEYGYLSGRSVDDEGHDAVATHAREPGPIRRMTIYQQCIEFAMFVRRASLGAVRFDENMGVGSRAPWQSDEGPDFMLRLEAEGVHGYYDPRFAVWHPRMTTNFNLSDRAYNYACGSGYFLRKHNYPFWYFAKINVRTFCGVLLGLATFQFRKAQYYWIRLRGRWRGWNGYTLA